MKIQRNLIAIRPFMSPVPDNKVNKLTQHRHNGIFELFYCAKGNGIQIVEQWRQQVSPGELIVIPPGVPHVFAGQDDGCFPEVLHLSRNYFNTSSIADSEALAILHHLRGYVIDHGYHIPLSYKRASQCGELIARIFTISKELPPAVVLQIKSAIYELLQIFLAIPEINEAMRNESERELRHDEKIQRVLLYLENHFAEPVHLDDMLKLSGMGRSCFFERFKQVTKFPFSRYLNRLRLRAVAELIQNGIPSEEAAKRCGFFSRSNYYQQRKNENLADSK